MKWLRIASRFEGLIKAHRDLKAEGDDIDRVLWALSDEVSKEITG